MPDWAVSRLPMVKKGQCHHGWVNATQVLTGNWGDAVHLGHDVPCS